MTGVNDLLLASRRPVGGAPDRTQGSSEGLEAGESQGQGSLSQPDSFVRGDRETTVPAAPGVSSGWAAPVGQQPLPPPISAVTQYIHDFYHAPREPSSMQGLVFEEQPDGSVETLRRSSQTTPDVPAAGPDIPANAVKNNRVLMEVDGIHEVLAKQEDQIHRLLEATPADHDNGASVGQPVIGIHEATGSNIFADGFRIAKDLSILKALQGHALPCSWARTVAFYVDPTVRSIHNEVRQSLEAGRDCQMVVHSGGGAETALALSILAREDGGRWKNQISQHVRILALSPACAVKDFERAGVNADGVYYTASRRDPLYQMSHQYVPPILSGLLLARGVVAGLPLLWNQQAIAYHSPDYIFWRNMEPDGKQRIQGYLDGGSGGDHVVS